MDSIKIIFGQVFWAIAQAFVIFALTRQERGADLAGYYGLSVAIFTPISLFANFNLRNLIAIDRDRKINPKAALVVRSISASMALFIAMLVVAQSRLDPLVLLAITALVATRLPDQLSEIAAGVFQREGKFQRIGLSFFCRGTACAIPLAIALAADQYFVIAAIASLLFSLMACVLVDIAPIVKSRGGWDLSCFFLTMRGKYWGAPYPVIDTLHFSLFRYAVSYFLPIQTLGLLSVAQAMYAPVQLVLSATGYVYMIKAKRLLEFQVQRIRLHAWKGVGIGFLMSGIFSVTLALVPEDVLLNFLSLQEIPGARHILLVVPIAMLPMSMGGLPAQILLAMSRFKSYLFIPILGVCFFSLSCCVSMFLDIHIEFEIIALLFALSYAARFVFTLCAVSLGLRRLTGAKT